MLSTNRSIRRIFLTFLIVMHCYYYHQFRHTSPHRLIASKFIRFMMSDQSGNFHWINWHVNFTNILIIWTIVCIKIFIQIKQKRQNTKNIVRKKKRRNHRLHHQKVMQTAIPIAMNHLVADQNFNWNTFKSCWQKN